MCMRWLAVLVWCLVIPVSARAQDKDWVKNNRSDKFPEDRFMQFIGTGTTIDEAENQAYLGLARMIEVTIKAEETYQSSQYMSGQKGQVTSQVEERSQSKVNLNLQGLRIEDRHYGKKNKTHYALAVLDRHLAGNALRADITEKDKRYRNYLDQGKLLVENKSYYEAIDKLAVCHSELLRIQNSLKKLRVILPDPEFEKTIGKDADEAKVAGLVDAILKDEEHGGLDVVTAALVYRLFGNYDQNMAASSVVIGNFNYQNTRMSSAFTAYFKEKIEVESSKLSGIKVIGSKSMSGYLKSHGIEFDGTHQGLAAISGADATIIGSYWELDDRIEIRTQIISRATGESLGSANVSFPVRYIPKSIDHKPDNFSQIQSDLALLKDEHTMSELKVVVWTDRGDGAVYKENEKLLVYVKANKDCYVRVIYHDAGGNNIQIFPNALSEKSFKVSANTVYTIGGEDSPFSFTIGEPFGTELIKAFASSTPFPEFTKSEAEMVGQGMYLLKKSTRDILSKLKSSKQSELTEASVSLTTVKKLDY